MRDHAFAEMHRKCPSVLVWDVTESWRSVRGAENERDTSSALAMTGAFNGSSNIAQSATKKASVAAIAVVTALGQVEEFSRAAGGLEASENV